MKRGTILRQVSIEVVTDQQQYNTDAASSAAYKYVCAFATSHVIFQFFTTIPEPRTCSVLQYFPPRCGTLCTKHPPLTTINPH